MSEIIKVEMKVRTDATDKWFSAPSIYDSNGTAAVNLAFDVAGKISYQNSSGTALQSYSSKTWYKILLVINTDK
ncbi:hypothetical protein [Paenibacillus segetis]|uniref:Uncharacterized protein n=1 Tax=Paenibacillus segetis TaxID=1325360 RepID=A0ABQ1YRR0_9BACL|nr:hypothetical protein [Paenibacillus segetis]GGH35332.1 hypothetical protein GCM10008013_41580 [Paenibacillus segetis]